MKSKKLVSILAITSILGTSIVTPFNVLAETPVQAAVSATAPTYVAPTTQNKVLEVSPGPYLQMVRFDGDYITLNLIKFVKGYGVRVVLPNGTSREFYSQYAAGAQNEFVYIYVGDQNLTSPYSFFSTEGLYSNGKPYPNSYHTFYTAQYMGYQYDTAFGQKVYNLFQDGSLSTIGSGVTQAEIDAARAAAANAPASPEKDKLVNLITKAQTEFTNNTASKNTAARDAVNALFTNNTPTSGAIKPTTTQSTIDAAKALANQVTDATQKAAMLADIQKAQDLLNTRTQQQADNAAADQSVKALYLNDNPATDAIKSITNQSAINKAQDAVNKVTDAVTKAALQKQVDRAQELLNNRTTQAAADQAQQAVANYAVNQLFLNNTPASDAIKASTNQAAIDSAQAEINKIKDPALKVEPQKNLDRAQELLDQRNANASQAEKAKQDAAKKAVDELFNSNTPTSGAIKPATNQKAIDDAQKLVDAITDPAVKAERQADLNKAQDLLDAKNAAATEKAKQDAAKKAVDELFNSNTPTSGAIK
uniref:toxin Cry1Ac domain D-VI-related protein n=2 Tax=Listeria newyorkensis TaxID=1497681 RepID=UPI00207B9E14